MRNSDKRNKELVSVAQMHPDTPSIDLHGYSVFEAELEVDTFLNTSLDNGESVVKIIHGKGSGILADAMRNFLSMHRMVQYMEPAMGTYESGAVIYVILE